MNVSVDVSSNAVIPKIMGVLSPEARKDLHAAGAESLAYAIQTHIRRYVFSKHATAHRLGAQPTGHYEKGAAAIHTNATDRMGEVVVPIPGIQRAFGDMEISADAAGALTIPISELSYGRRAAEMKALGWKLFPAISKKTNADLLMGRRGIEVKALYVLKPHVHQRKDPSLMPTAEDMQRNVAGAILARIKSIVEKARRQKAS